MIEITSDTAADYLRSTGRAVSEEPVTASELAGGVSNLVLLVTLPSRGEQFVLKQARGRLRVKEEWLCSVERIWREVEVLQACGEILQSRSAERGVRSQEGWKSCVPWILWEDRENYLYAMSAAAEDHRTWKELLLAGEIQVSLEIAAASGGLLATLHGRSWQDPSIAARFSDRSYFDQLRLDPYYRQVARVHPALSPAIDQLLESLDHNRCCLVHGDFSPKNLLVWPGHLMLIDFEVGHYGDPAFELGFFLAHLVLKCIWSGLRRGEYSGVLREFWNAYRLGLSEKVSESEMAALEGRMMLNLSGCLLARVDGKSPVDYLSAEQQQRVRLLAITWLQQSPPTLEAAIGQVLRLEA